MGSARCRADGRQRSGKFSDVGSELAKIAFADAKDYVPQPGEELDITRLNSDQTTAIQNIQIEDIVDAPTGDIRRRTRVRLHDKTAALTTLAKSLGMLSEKHIVEGSLEHIISQLTPEQRLERIRALREKARVEYLPRYEAALRRGGLPAPEQIINGIPADEPEARGEAAQTSEVAGNGSAIEADAPDLSRGRD